MEKIDNIISVKEAVYIGEKIIEFYKEFNDITDYYMTKKFDKLKDIKETLFDGFGQCDNLFDDFNMEPKDFNIKVYEASTNDEIQLWKDLSQITATFPIEDVPGKNLRLLVKETNTDKILGMIRLSSPVISIIPRNKMYEENLDLETVNKNIMNGTVIVPSQPFGYNILGGKLMALICTSNEVKKIFEDKFKKINDIDVNLFETTSLYGSIKGVSQYDGLKPFIRYGGDTESALLLNLPDKLFNEIREIFTSKDPTFTEVGNSSIKLRVNRKIIRYVTKTLKVNNHPFYEEFIEGLKHAETLTTKKRYYYCDYGIQNSKDVIKNGVKPIYREGMSKEKFDLDNIVEWWKKKAQKRFEKLKNDGTLRQELEFWNLQKLKDKSIDIIR